MKQWRLVKAAWRALGARKMRSALATVGITIGVAAVVAVVSIGEGTRAEMVRTIEKMGANLLVVTPAQIRMTAGRERRTTEATTLTPDDAQSIAEQIADVVLAVPAQSQQFELTWEGRTTSTTVVATVPEFQQARDFHPERGEFFDDRANRARAREAVLGRTVVRELFDEDDPLDATIRIGRVPFNVTGVMEQKGLDIGGQDQDNQVFIPLNTGLRRVFNVAHLGTVLVQVAQADADATVQEEIGALLRERHHLRDRIDDDFTISDQAEMIEAQQQISSSITALLAGIGGISLFVGGVGIMAVMLISVRERTREIGLRRAIGATRRDIQLQFLVEAGILGLVGSALGVLLGLAGAAVTAALTQWGATVSVPAIVGAVSFSALIGIIFGLYPARQASLRNPIEALRAE